MSMVGQAWKRPKGPLALIRVAALLVLLGPAAALAENRLALVIGNDAYQEVDPLDRAVADAQAYKTLLEQERGFKVFYAENATRRAMNASVADFLAAIRPGDTAMIVYSGHGVQLDSERRDSLYLLPIDFPNQDPGRGAERHFFDSESLNFARLAENVASRGAKLRIFVLDACRNNPFSRENGTRAIGLTRGIGRIQSARGEFVVYAAAPGEVAFDSLPDDAPDSVNSVFTRAFIKHFKTGVYLEDVVNDVQAEVVRLARAANVAQEPYYSDGVAGRTCLEESCGAAPPPGDAKIVAEQEALYWTYCAENDEPLYCKAFIEQYPDSWRAGLAKARLKVLATRATGEDGPEPRLAAVDGTGRSGTGNAAMTPTDGSEAAPKATGGASGVTLPRDNGLTPEKESDAPASDGAKPVDREKASDKKASDKSDSAQAEKDATEAKAPDLTAGETSDKGAVETRRPPDQTEKQDRPASTDATPADGNVTPPAKTGSGAVAKGDTRNGAASSGESETAGGTGPSRESVTDENIEIAAVDPKKVVGHSIEPIRPTRDQLRDVQARLTILGHRPGPIDGLMGRRTRNAISAFQNDAGMQRDGAVSEALLARLAHEVPDDKLAAYWAEQEAAARARAERNRAARQRAARERNTRQRGTRERTTRTRENVTRERTTTPRDSDAAARSAAEAAKRRAEAERAREANRRTEAARKRRQPIITIDPTREHGTIKLRTRDRTTKKPFYCNNPTKATSDPACF